MIKNIIFKLYLKCKELMYRFQRQNFIHVSRRLGAKLDGFICDGLELVVASAVHVKVKLQKEDAEETGRQKQRCCVRAVCPSE